MQVCVGCDRNYLNYHTYGMFSIVDKFVILSVLAIDVLVVMYVGKFVEMFVATFMDLTELWFGGGDIASAFAGPSSSS